MTQRRRYGGFKTRTKQHDKDWPYAWIDGAPVDYCDTDELVKLVDDDMFHIGQCYEDEAAKTLECAKCGGREFNVGSGDFFTAVRCIKCEWEICWHNG
jgi:hypothetical protein